MNKKQEMIEAPIRVDLMTLGMEQRIPSLDHDFSEPS
jgi:hypothetical protein